LEGKNILLVEDDLIIQMILKKNLSGLGFSIYLAENGKEALEYLILGLEIDLIITDIMMPVMDGNQLASILKSEGNFSRIPIIAMTAGNITAQMQEYPTLFDLVFEKPTSLEILKKSILELVSTKI
jgi:CheY-like chemotaxis protein